MKRSHAVCVCLSLLFTFVSAGTIAASPQDQPTSLESANGPEIPGLAEDLAHRLQIGGFGVVSALRNQATGDTSFEGSALAVSLFRPVNDRISIFAQLTAHRAETEPFDDPGAPPEEGSGFETEIDNLQVSWAAAPSAGLGVIFGKFDSPLGIERDDAPLNYEATRSFTYDFARPAKFTGIQLQESFSPHFELTGVVANGWDADTGSGGAKTGALYAMFNPSLSAHVGFGVIHGAADPGGPTRNDYIATLLLQPRHDVVLGGEAVVGRQAAESEEEGAARWLGTAVFVHHRFPGNFAATVRGEYFRDRDGLLTGTGQTIRSLTVSPQILFGGGGYGAFRFLERTSLPLPEIALKLDLRFDHSNQDVFPSTNEEVTKRDRFTATLQAVVLF